MTNLGGEGESPNEVPVHYQITTQANKKWSSVFLTGVLGMLWLLGPSGVEFSEDVDSWRVRGL